MFRINVAGFIGWGWDSLMPCYFLASELDNWILPDLRILNNEFIDSTYTPLNRETCSLLELWKQINTILINLPKYIPLTFSFNSYLSTLLLSIQSTI